MDALRTRATAEMRRVVVTGAAGHLGRHVVEALVGAGHLVHGVDHRPFPAGDRQPQQMTVADLRVWDGLDAALAETDALVHLAAIPNLDHHPEAVVFETNVALTARLAFAAMSAGIGRFVYASSQTVLGQALAPELVAPDFVPVDETHALTPRDGLSKEIGERFCKLVAERLGIAALALRLPSVWAPKTSARHLGKRLGDPVQAAKSLWAYVDARDAGEAFRLAVECDFDGFAALNLSAERPFSDTDIRVLLDQWFPNVQRIGPIGAQTPLFAIDRAGALLGYRPRYVWHPDHIEDCHAPAPHYHSEVA